MPELPEVQAHAERLERAYAGAVLARFEPLTFTALKTFDPRPESAVGATVASVGRRGKYLLLDLGDTTFVVHLMQGGRLVADPKGSKRPRFGIARWWWDGDLPALLLTEAGTERKAGAWVVAGDGEAALAAPPLDRLGPEADELDAVDLEELFSQHSMRLHTFLRDQSILAGLGRRLANEVCHRARLSPFASTSRLGAAGASAVAAAIGELVAEGLAFEREQEVMVASAQRPAAVHGRTGEPCQRCGDVVREVAYSGYTVSYCATCQTGGKVLADNTTSKFLK